MTKYLIKRIIRSLISVVIVLGVIMTMIYTFLDKQSIFASDPVFTKQKSNNKRVYMMQQWEQFGYLDYVPYADFLTELVKSGELAQEDYASVAKLGKDADADKEEVALYVQRFTEKYEAEGYTVERLDGDTQGRTKKYKDGGEKFSPAIMGNGTIHKYLLYMDNEFPFIHQNLIRVNLGKSYAVNKGIDVFDTMTNTQGSYVRSTVYYPSGTVEETADDLHSATYVAGSLALGELNQKFFVDDYTSVITRKDGLS